MIFQVSLGYIIITTSTAIRSIWSISHAIDIQHWVFKSQPYDLWSMARNWLLLWLNPANIICCEPCSVHLLGERDLPRQFDLLIALREFWPLKQETLFSPFESILTLTTACSQKTGTPTMTIQIRTRCKKKQQGTYNQIGYNRVFDIRLCLLTCLLVILWRI
jgi:hypothetical protein